MVVVAQLVRAPGCGPGGRGFETHLPPKKPLIYRRLFFKVVFERFFLIKSIFNMFNYFNSLIFIFLKYAFPG